MSRNDMSRNEKNRIGLRRMLRLACCVGGFVLLASVAAASGGEEKSQGEILKELAWQTLNLAILLGVLFHFGRTPIRDFFATRRSGIQSELSQAAELLTQAEQRNSELQRRLVDLNSDVDGIKSAASQRASDEADRILEDARAAAERIRTDAHAAIAQELRRAQSKLREEAADLALELAAKKLEEEISSGDRDRLVDEFIVRIEPGTADSAGGANQ
jgi:F-type H+-transporting ATPase subunit b